VVSDRVKVLYIAGSGRSGSTILDNVLGQLDGFVSAGELRFLWERGLVENRLCGCRRPLKECPTWQAILTDAYGSIDAIDPRRMMWLQQQGLRARHLPLMLGHRYGGRLLRSRTAELPTVLDHLYASLRRQTRSRVIIDSSKLPTYGFLLGTLPSIDLYVLHLIRDPRATAYSWMRKKDLPDRGQGGFMQQQGPFKSAFLWSLWNSTPPLLWRKKGDRYLRIHYERFVEQPEPAVREIATFVGEHPERLPFASSSSVRLAPNHSVAGNPSRFQTGLVELRPDDEWKTRMRPAHRALVTAITAPLLAAYGYPIRDTA
jgi:hypothetical protein